VEYEFENFLLTMPMGWSFKFFLRKETSKFLCYFVKKDDLVFTCYSVVQALPSEAPNLNLPYLACLKNIFPRIALLLDWRSISVNYHVGPRGND
jgi:hypothetical protein